MQRYACVSWVLLTASRYIIQPFLMHAMYAPAQKYASLTALHTEAPASTSCETCVLAVLVMTFDVCLQCCIATGRSVL